MKPDKIFTTSIPFWTAAIGYAAQLKEEPVKAVLISVIILINAMLLLWMYLKSKRNNQDNVP